MGAMRARAVSDPCASLRGALGAVGTSVLPHLGPPLDLCSHCFPSLPCPFPFNLQASANSFTHSFIHSPSDLGPHLRPAQWWGPQCPGAAPALWAQSPQRGPSTHVASFSLSDSHPSFLASITCQFLQEAFQVSPDRNDSSCSYLKLSGYTSHPVSLSPHLLILTKCSHPTPGGCPLPALH